MNLAKSILNVMLDASKHLDEKAGRILYSMAFVTTATATIFSAFLFRGWMGYFDSFPLVPTFFVIYLFFLLIGTYFMLDALGPEFFERKHGNKDSWKTMSPSGPKSIWYFKKVSQTDYNIWSNYFMMTDLRDVLRDGAENALHEAHEVANNVVEKVSAIRLARFFFLISLLALIAMVLAGVSSIPP